MENHKGNKRSEHTIRHKPLLPTAAEYTFFPRTCGTFSKIDHIPGHKTGLSEFKNTEVIQSIFSTTLELK